MLLTRLLKRFRLSAQQSFHQICRTMLGPPENVCDIVEGMESCISKAWFKPLADIQKQLTRSLLEHLIQLLF